MDRQNKIINIDQQGNEIHFILNPDAEWPLGTPTGKMLTDTDRHSFVYVFDHESGYRYAYFSQDSWNGLVDVLLKDAHPILVCNEETLPMEGLKEELQALIFNIEGNHNYGEEFSAAVEEVFQPVLEQVD
ncbi:hypothetical protein ORD22_01335 [Sporosarcina sp. GW1-11]|uniref:UPF0738 family protein n=1 Tax=Sporosarcina sp. GW1-11 TaxID=2899126 RepID=UPI00294EF3FD|nr:hypothetical protein [Sporosarcina sp. GW1-11]MDV6376907.1 hypothetical protein [Sporosarcina sp. GW1-11]